MRTLKLREIECSSETAQLVISQSGTQAPAFLDIKAHARRLLVQGALSQSLETSP